MTLVFKFGVRSILDGREHAHREMRDAHRYYNALVAIERWKRREYSVIRSRYVPGLAEIESAYEQLDEWIGEHAGPAGKRGGIREKRRAETARTGRPTKRVDATEEIDVIAELKRWRKEASALAKPLRAAFAELVDPGTAEHKRRASAAANNHERKRLNASVRDSMLGEPEWSAAWRDVARLQATAYDLRNWVQDAHSLNHGTYAAVRDDVARAGKRPPPRPDGEPRKPRQRPAFSRRGLRKLGWQLQKRPTWGDVLGGRCSELRVTDVRPVGGSGRRLRATMAIRISTGDPRAPQWVTCDVAIHRPVPDDTVLSWVYLVPEERPHGRWEYSVQLTAEPTSPLVVRAPGRGHVELHLRWTQVGDTLEVARVNGEPLLLPGGRGGICERLRHAERLRGYSDEHFDVAREETIKRLRHLPADVQVACVGIAQWRDHRKLARVSEILREHVPDGRESWATWREMRLRAGLDLFASLDDPMWTSAMGADDALTVFSRWLETWRRKDKHLEQMADGTRRRACAQRKDFYRVTAVRLSEQFKTYSLSGAVDLAALALRDKAEDHPAELHQSARHHRTFAGLYELKEALAAAFGGERFRDADPAGGSRSSGVDHGSLAEGEAAE